MRIAMQFYGQLRQFAGEGGSRDFAEGSMLADVILNFLDRANPAAREIVFAAEGGLRPSLIVLVNGTPVAKDKPMVMREGDQITLLAAIAGG